MAYLISEHQNMTSDPISFQGKGVRDAKFPFHVLDPNSTGIVKLYRVMRYCRRQEGLNWTLSVFRAQKYTGVELTPDHLTKYTRLIFRCETKSQGENKLLVEGVREKIIDLLLSNRFFGYYMRNAVWDKRPTTMIGQEDPPRSDNIETCSDNRELNRDHCHADVTEKDRRIKISMEFEKEGETHKFILEFPGGVSSCTSASSYSRVSSGFTQSDAEDNIDHF